MYKYKNIVGRTDFSAQFWKIIICYKRIGYNLNVMRKSACLVFNPITVNNYDSLFNCTPMGRASDYDGLDLKLFICARWGWSFFVCWLAIRVQLVILFCFRFSVVLFDFLWISRQHVASVEFSSLNLHGTFCDLIILS